MEYNVFIGLLASVSLGWQEWVFLSVILFFIFSGISAYINLNRGSLFKNDKKNKKKIIMLMGIFLLSFILFGLVGLISFVLIHIIIISFISDYGLGKK
jgi:fatty acid desaturase